MTHSTLPIDMTDLKQYIRSVPNFPKEGVNFYDITTLFSNPIAFDAALSRMSDYVMSKKGDKIVGIEARGFVLGAAIAARLNLPFIPARKPGKLPYEKISEEYELEYGKDKVEMHTDAVSAGERVIVVDDLIATGGTIHATCKLVRRLGGTVAGISVIIGLDFFPYRKLLSDYDINYLISYDSE